MSSLLFDWSLLWTFVIKGFVSCMLIAFIGYGIANIHCFKDDDPDIMG